MYLRSGNRDNRARTLDGRESAPDSGTALKYTSSQSATSPLMHLPETYALVRISPAKAPEQQL
jgi:hypothetical protein